MQKHGLTRKEAEAFINQHSNSGLNQPRLRRVISPSREEEDPLIPEWIWWALLGITGVGLVAIRLFEWLEKRARKEKRKEEAEWLV